MNKPIVHISKNFKEAEIWQIKYETSLTSQQRLESQHWLRKHYCNKKGIKFPSHIQKIVKIYKMNNGKRVEL